MTSARSPAMAPETRERLLALAIGDGMRPADAWRAVRDGTDGGRPEPIRYQSAAAVIRRARRSTRPDATDLRADGLARRILRVIDRELAAIERKRTPTDLDRLSKLATTLRQVEPLQPKAKRERGSGLSDLASLGVAPSGDGESEPEENGAPPSGEPREPTVAPARLSDLGAAAERAI